MSSNNWVVVGKKYGSFVAKAIEQTGDNEVRWIISQSSISDHTEAHLLEQLEQKEINLAYIATPESCHKYYVNSFSRLKRTIVETQVLPHRVVPHVEFVDTMIMRRNFSDFIFKTCAEIEAIEQIVVLSNSRTVASCYSTLQAIRKYSNTAPEKKVKICVTNIPLFGEEDDDLASPLGAKLIALGKGIFIELASPNSEVKFERYGEQRSSKIDLRHERFNSSQDRKTSSIKNVIQRTDIFDKLRLDKIHDSPLGLKDSKSFFEQFLNKGQFCFCLSKL